MEGIGRCENLSLPNFNISKTKVTNMILCYPTQELTDEQKSIVESTIPEEYQDYYTNINLIITDSNGYQTLLENQIPVSNAVNVKTLGSLVIPEEIETFITTKLIQKLIEDAFSNPDEYFDKNFLYTILENYKNYLELNRVNFISLDPKKDFTYELTGFWQGHGIVSVNVVKPDGNAYTFTMEIPVTNQTYYYQQDVQTPLVNINSFNTSTLDYAEVSNIANILYQSGIAYESFFKKDE